MSDASSPAQPGRGARIAIAIGRILLGLLFLVGGTVNLLMAFHVMPEHNEGLPPRALAFSQALSDTGYMMPLIAITQVTVALMLLSNRFVPLALALLAPFMVNSVAFHLVLEPTGRPVSFIIFAAMLALAWAYRGAYRPMLAARARPGG